MDGGVVAALSQTTLFSLLPNTSSWDTAKVPLQLVKKVKADTRETLHMLFALSSLAGKRKRESSRQF